MRTQDERAPTEYALLGLLMDGPSHGYDLTRQFSPQSELGQVCHLEMSMLYALLKKLEREGWIVGRDEAITEHKSRRVVELSPQGRAEFENWIARPVQKTREIRLDFLVKFYFARQQNPALAMQLLQEQLDYSEALLERLHLQRDKAANLPQNHFERLVINLRIEQNEAVLRWLRECLAMIAAGQAN